MSSDFDLSISILSQSFITWHRLCINGLVTELTVKDISCRTNWREKYPSKFLPLHRGSTCTDSIVIGIGKYSKVYRRGNFAYKYIKINDKSLLKYNLKELLFFHSMNHPHIMRPIRSQVIMEHGIIKRICHEMTSARCTLLNMIQSGEITSYNDLENLLRGVCEGLDYMHMHHIIHGDVTPSNILVMDDLKSMVSDFTLTTCEGKGMEISFGTLFWRAPECLLKRECTTASDVWSFGVLLLDCVYGCVYFRDILGAKDNDDMIIKIRGILGQPPVSWVHKYLSNNTNLLFEQSESTFDKLELSDRKKLLGTEKTRASFLNLIEGIFKWEPTERITMSQIMKHQFFQSSSFVSKPKQEQNTHGNFFIHMFSNSLGSTKFNWNIEWRNSFEKVHIVDTIREWHSIFCGEKQNPICPQLIKDIAITCKFLLERLRSGGFIFNTRNVVKWCTALYCFIWGNYWNPEPEFQSALYHVITLIGFVGFPLQVSESTLGQSQASETPNSTVKM